METMTVAFNYLGKLGQLGNQMFQFATTLGVARYTGVTYSIPNRDEVLDGLGNRLRIELFQTRKHWYSQNRLCCSGERI